MESAAAASIVLLGWLGNTVSVRKKTYRKNKQGKTEKDKLICRWPYLYIQMIV